MLDPNRFKGEITAMVQQQTGRTLEIEGNLHLSLFPSIALETGRLRLGNAPGFGAEPFAEIDKAEIRVGLLPLLSRKLEIKHLVFQGLRLNLTRNPSGQTNWQDLSGKKTTGKRPAVPGEPRLPPLVLGGFTLKDGTLEWRDLQSQKTLLLDHLNVHLDRLRFAEPADFSLGFVLHQNQYPLKEIVSLHGTLLIEKDLQKFQLNDFQLQSLSEGPAIPAGHLEATLDGSAGLDLASQTLGVKKLRLQTAGALLTGTVSATGLLEKPRLSGNFRLQAPLRTTLTQLGITLPRTADPQALSKLDLSFTLAAGADDLALRNLQGTMDDTHWIGRLAMDSLSPPHVEFQLEADAIDADRYLPQVPPADPASDQDGRAPSPTPGAPLLLDKLAAQNLDGHILIGNLKLKGIRMEGVTLTATSKDRVLILTPAVARLYQGSYRGKLRIDARGALPEVALDSQIQKVALDSLLRDYFGREPWLSGTAFLRLDLHGRGSSVPAIKRTLNGKIAFQVQDGSLNQVEYLRLIKQGEAWWQGETQPPSETQIDKLRFVRLEFLAPVQDGVIRCDRCLIDSRKLRIEGGGNIDLGNDQMDYTVRAVRLRHEAKADDQEITRAKGMPIIIRIEGPLAKPRYRLDLVQMAQERFKKKIQKKQKALERKITEKLEKKLGPGAGQLLKGLLRP